MDDDGETKVLLLTISQDKHAGSWEPRTICGPGMRRCEGTRSRVVEVKWWER